MDNHANNQHLHIPRSRTSMDNVQPTSASQRNRITVAVRVRPLNAREVKNRRVPIVRVSKHGVDPLVQISRLAKRGACLKSEMSAHWEYGFDCGFGPEVQQETVYEHTVKPLIGDLLGGINSTVFAYGATGAGKTHTMMGGDGEKSGVIPRALQDIFRKVEVQKEQAAANKLNGMPEETIVIELAYMEVYNEKIYDLLNPGNKRLEPREDPSKGIVIVAGLERRVVNSEKEVMKAVHGGNACRKMEATAANQVSSRSHAVLQVFVTRTTAAVPGKSRGRIVRGVMNLIDLAGSERASNTKNRGMRLTEGAMINRSLLALANCINALSKGKGCGQRVKYRDSKLTHLLKSSLEGNCAMVMIAAINPSNHTFEESHNTLKYANRAKSISIKPTAHEQAFSPAPKVKAAMLADENQKLKLEILALRNAKTEAGEKLNVKNKNNVLVQPRPPMEKRREAWSTQVHQVTPAPPSERDDNESTTSSVEDNRCEVQKRHRRNRRRSKADDAAHPLIDVSSVSSASLSTEQDDTPSKENVALLSMTGLSDLSNAPSMTNLSNAPSMSEFEMPTIAGKGSGSSNMIDSKEIYEAFAVEAKKNYKQEISNCEKEINTLRSKISKQAHEKSQHVTKIEKLHQKVESKDEIIAKLRAEVGRLKAENKTLVNNEKVREEQAKKLAKSELAALKAKVAVSGDSAPSKKRKILSMDENTKFTSKEQENIDPSSRAAYKAASKSDMEKDVLTAKKTNEIVSAENVSKVPTAFPTSSPPKRRRRSRRKSMIPVFMGGRRKSKISKEMVAKAL
jgi:hypothetical protein